VDNNIPIYIIENIEYKKFVEFFIKGNGVNYIKLYNNNQYYSPDNLNIFNIFKL
jgi:hypothetical protein